MKHRPLFRFQPLTAAGFLVRACPSFRTSCQAHQRWASAAWPLDAAERTEFHRTANIKDKLNKKENQPADYRPTPRSP